MRMMTFSLLNEWRFDSTGGEPIFAVCKQGPLFDVSCWCPAVICRLQMAFLLPERTVFFVEWMAGSFFWEDNFVLLFVKQVDANLLLMYNDELPNGTTSQSAAHAKGVVAFDRSAGFWMLHSVPRYPPDSGATYSYPVTGFKYGQTLLCLTLPFSSANEIGNHRNNFWLELRASPTMARWIDCTRNPRNWV